MQIHYQWTRFVTFIDEKIDKWANIDFVYISTFNLIMEQMFFSIRLVETYTLENLEFYMRRKLVNVKERKQ